jgi:hypothetical protein
MRRFPRFTPLLALLALAALLTAGCAQQPSPPTPTPTLSPTSTPVPPPTQAPTATPAPSPTSRPTATPAVRPTATPRPVAARPVSTAAPGPIASGGTPFGDLPEDLLLALVAMFPTAPPAPQGRDVVLSMEELEGLWDGWITIDSIAISGMPLDDQKACEDQMALIRGRQLPIGMDFYPESAGAGTVLMIKEQQMDPEEEDKPAPYRYRDGMLTIEAEEDQGVSRFEGRTIESDGETVISGTWTSRVIADEEMLGTGIDSPDSAELTLEGRWGLTRSPVAVR